MLYLDINSYQRSNIAQMINISIWDRINSKWDFFNSSNYITTFQLASYSSAVFSNYIDTDGKLLLMYYGVNKTNDFEFHLDQLEFKIWKKIIISTKITT